MNLEVVVYFIEFSGCYSLESKRKVAERVTDRL